MNTLIIYGSKYGYTEECVKKLSKKLIGAVDAVNIKKDKVPNLSTYNNVIIGGSIYIGQIQKEIKKFCTDNAEVLKEKRIGLFICCGFEENFQEHIKNAFNKELIDTAVTKKCFGGQLNIEKMNFIDKVITKMVAKQSAKNGKEGANPLPNNIDEMAQVMNSL